MVSKQDHFELYMYWASYNSQKVRLLLHIKDIDYSIRVIAQDKLENYDPDYLRINKNGTVPTLKQNGMTIGDTDVIMKYLDEHYTPKLLPDPGTKDGQTVQHLCNRINSIKTNVIIMGAFLHPGLTKSSKVSADVVKRFQDQLKGKEEEKLLERLMEENANMKDVYENLLEDGKIRTPMAIYSEENTLEAVKEACGVLNELEYHLDETRAETGAEACWLCGDVLTLADVLLTVNLFWLTCVGFSRATFTDGQLPLVDQYYDYAKVNLPGFKAICVNFKQDSNNQRTKPKKGCTIL